MRLETLTYSQLRYNPAINARGRTETDLTELVAQIKASGIGQPLLVRQADDGAYEPVEGGRRFRAVGQLIESGTFPADYPIPVLVREMTDAEAIELSLMTAITREPLNPADEAVSFAALVKGGTTPDEIAAHFGVPRRRVEQRLAIAALPTKIVQALREKKIGIDAAQAYTVGRDKKEVERVFAEMSKAGRVDASQIRAALTSKRIRGDSRDAKFVGIEAYRAAGGQVDEDLFSRAVWFTDGKLLAKLVEKKKEAEEERLLAEGWSFVMFTDPDRGDPTYSWPKLSPEGRRKNSAEDKERIKAIVERLTFLRESGAINDDESDEGLEWDDLVDEKSELEQLPYTIAQKAKSGVVVRVHNHDISYHFGMMKPAEAKKQAKASKQKAAEKPDPAAAPRESEAEADFTGANNTEMAKAMTAALQDAVVAQAPITEVMACAVLIKLATTERPIPFHLVTEARFTAATATVEEELSEHIDRLTGSDETKIDDLADLITLLLPQLPETIRRLSALSLASVLALGSNITEADAKLIKILDPVVDWQPGEEFLKRMSREYLVAALGEAAIPGATPSKKKGELIEICLSQLVPLGWLPKPLRTPSYKGPGSNEWSDAHAEKTADQINQQAAE